MVDEIKRALEIAEVVPFRYLIQHLGVSGEPFQRTESGRRVLGARGIEYFCEAARRGDSSGEYSERSFERGAASLFSWKRRIWTWDTCWMWGTPIWARAWTPRSRL